MELMVGLLIISHKSVIILINLDNQLIFPLIQKTIINDINNSTVTPTTSAKNITIEMPERLLTGRQMSPRTRERNINKVVKNIGHIVEDVKKRYHGDISNKVIVKIDKDGMQTD